MLTISDRVEQWIGQHPFHAGFLAEGLMNASALGRVIQPELEAASGEKVSLEAITLALNRLGKRLGRQMTVDYGQYIGEVSVQTGLSVLSVRQTDLALDVFFETMQRMHANREYCLFTRGVWHTALIGKRAEIAELSCRIADGVLIDDQVAITIRLRPGHMPVPGVCAYILQMIAFHGINVTETASTLDEMTIIVDTAYTRPMLDCLL